MMTDPNGDNLARSLDEHQDPGTEAGHNMFQTGLEMMLGNWFPQGGGSASSAAVSVHENTTVPSPSTGTPSFFSEPPQGPAEVISLTAGVQDNPPGPRPDPAKTAALLEAAGQARLNGDFEEAEKLYSSLANNDPRNAEAVHGLGLLALEDGDITKAESLISASMRLDPLHMLCGHKRP